jgi:dynein heavy chain
MSRQRLDNANRLIDTLSSIRGKWQTRSLDFESSSSKLVGDAVVAAAILNYCSPFNQAYRSFLLRDKVYRNLEIHNIPFNLDFSLGSFLLSSNQMDRWHSEGLTNDTLATENATIVHSSSKHLFIIDPEEQFFQWITSLKQNSADSVHVVHSPSCKDLFKIFENCVSTGQKLLLQDAHLDDASMSIVESFVDRPPSYSPIKLNENKIHIQGNFVLYCHTTDQFTDKSLKPAIYSDMTVINFSISLESFEQQMLEVVLRKERPDCTESTKSFKLLLKSFESSMQGLEVDTLSLLSESQGNIIENDTLLEALLENQAKGSLYSQKKKSTMEQLMRVDQAVEEYCVRNMSKIDHMYSTTLNEFLRVYDTNTCFSDAASLTSKRLSLLINATSQTILLHYTKGYTEAHCNLLGMSVAMMYGIVSGLCEPVAIQFLVHGGSQLNIESIPKKIKEWIPDRVWKNVIALSRINFTFQKLPELLVSSQDAFWKALFDHEEPELQEIAPLNTSADNPENEAWIKLLFIRAFREDRALASSKIFLKTVLGSPFKDSISDNQDLESLIDSPSSSWSVPNICIFQVSGHHSTNDFIMQISALSKRRRMDFKILAVTSESDSIIKILPKLMSSRIWLVLQNAHICPPILTEIYNILQNCETAHPEFRLWLTTESISSFPAALLQTSLKFRSKDQDPTIGGTIAQLYNDIGQHMYDSVALPGWRQTIYSLAFFHSLIVGRRKFGHAGWNMQYQFSNSEFQSTLSFAQAMFAEAELRKTRDCINFHSLRSVIAINYGGKILDSNDALVLRTLSEKYINNNMQDTSSLFGKAYKQPVWSSTDYNQARQHTGGLPTQDKAEAFGFYQSAEFLHATSTFQDLANCFKRTVGLEADSVLTFCAMLKVGATDYRPVSRSAFSIESASTVEVVMDYCNQCLALVPVLIENGVLQSRIVAHNKGNGGKLQFLFSFFLRELSLIEDVCKETTGLLKRILRYILTPGYKFNAANDEDSDHQIKRDISRIYRNATPETLQQLAFPFVSNMRVWFERLRKAGEQINQFIFRARPRCIWLSGINSPKGFLTAFRIENANKKGWTIEETILSIELSRYENESQIKEKEIPSELLYISGCNLEGATWFSKENRLMELSPRLLQSTCPLLSVTAAHSRCTQFQNTALFCFSTLTRLCSTIEPKGYSTFPCPLYTCTSIAGPQEFVTYVQIPIADEPMSKWVLRGVRLTCAQFS